MGRWQALARPRFSWADLAAIAAVMCAVQLIDLIGLPWWGSDLASLAGAIAGGLAWGTISKRGQQHTDRRRA